MSKGSIYAHAWKLLVASRCAPTYFLGQFFKPLKKNRQPIAADIQSTIKYEEEKIRILKHRKPNDDGGGGIGKERGKRHTSSFSTKYEH